MKLAAFITLTLITGSSFKTDQLKYERVKTAYAEKEAVVKSYFAERQLSYEGFQLFLRCFKDERKVEIWIKAHTASQWTLLHTYPFCSFSGTLGPKRWQGDYQIPEGVYKIVDFNPASNFYLSLGINYPNKSDRILSDQTSPGGDIYIHGNCVTVGCIPITDEGIKELYLMAVEAKNNGQNNIPVYIFPSRLTDEGISKLSTAYAGTPLLAFWKNLKPIYDDFEKTQMLENVRVAPDGSYYQNRNR